MRPQTSNMLSMSPQTAKLFRTWPRRRSVLRGALLIGLYIFLHPHSGLRGQVPAGLNTVVTAETTAQLENYWRIREAGLKEQLSGTNGYLVIENVSGATVDGVALYAEY